jgi:pimeloyl-ACP methyl ester carboxylesterase
MATVDEIETAARQWLNGQKGKLTLQRTLYLVPGFEDETAGCWLKGPNAIGDIWGPSVFTNWQMAVASRDKANTAKWKWANVRVLDFDAAVIRPSFLTFADVVRAAINEDYPDDQSSMGEFDVVGHSMGGLDAFAALVDDVDPNRSVPVPPAERIARAFNFVSMDTPYRGIPNWKARLKMTAQGKEAQCTAMAPDSPELKLLDAAASRLVDRAIRITTYGVDSVAQVEVISGDLYADAGRFAQERHAADYRFFQIPGASHSGPQGITQSVITIANLFYTLTTATRLSG